MLFIKCWTTLLIKFITLESAKAKNLKPTQNYQKLQFLYQPHEAGNRVMGVTGGC